MQRWASKSGPARPARADRSQKVNNSLCSRSLSLLPARRRCTHSSSSNLSLPPTYDSVCVWLGIGTARFLETDDEIELPDDKAGSSKQKKKTVKIPAGTFVMIPFYTLSRSQEAWGADPEQFNPQRFVPPPESAASGAAAGAAGKKKSKSSSDSAAAEEEDVEEEEKFGDAQFQANMDNVKINFSGGNRACPGFYMSINESVLFLARVLRAFDIALPAPSPAAAASSSSSSAAAAKDGNAAQKASSAAAAGGVELDCGIHLMPKEIKLVLTPRN